jgi:glycosyltransferase involved in cell wall biosynthesis
MLIELLNQLNNVSINAQLLICVLVAEEQSKEERKYYNSMKSKVDELKLSKKFVFYEVKNSEFYPILKKSKLYIRPTNTDGYGISIAEAIHFNVPSIASDVCVRPEGTLMFKSRDIDDLYEKTMDVIDNYDHYKESLNHIKVQDNSERLLRVYEEVLK